MTDTDPAPAVASPAAVAPAPEAPDHCLHCGANRLGDYCQACGQHYFEGRLTIRRLAREFAERFLKLERGLLGTFLGLCRGPGDLARAYVEGHRRPFVNPLSYVFIGAAASLLLLPLLFNGGASGRMAESLAWGEALGRSLNPSIEAMSPEQQAAVDEVMDRTLPLMMDAMAETMRQLNAVFAFAAALLMAAFFRLFFGGRYTYAEAAVPALYATGHYLILAVPLALLTFWLTDGTLVYTALAALAFGAVTVWTALGFYGRTWGTAALAGVSFVATYVLYTATVAVLSGGIAFWRVAPEMRAIAESVKAAHGL